MTGDAPRPDLDDAEHAHLVRVERRIREVVLRKGDWTADPGDLADFVAEYDRRGAALALHRPIPRKGYDHLTVCAEDGQVWPCRTRQTLTEEEA